MTDPTIREQSYLYFLQEAPELLQVLEQELLSLRENYSINKVHNLMRTTHTLKGAAASVGLETIKTVSHSLEDIFKALFNPDLSVDVEIEALLFEGYECLRLATTAQVTGGQINDTEILDRTAAIFAQLQDKLGDCFGEEAHIPSSVELGFDVTQSIFEVGVTQRLEELATAIANDDPIGVATILSTQSEVFLGLAESLNLPGFGVIAQSAIAALEIHPDQAVAIAQVALEDFRAGQAAVLNGDRTQGGQPSPTLQQLAHSSQTEDWQEVEQEAEDSRLPEDEQEFSPSLTSPEEDALIDFASIMSLADDPELTAPLAVEAPTDEADVDPQAPTIPSESEPSTLDSESNVNPSQDEEITHSLLELIWGGEAAIDAPTSETNPESQKMEQEAEEPSLRLTPTSAEPRVTIETSPSRHFNSEREPTPTPQKEAGTQSPTVRVNVEHLEHLNYSVGELLTHQNLQSLQNDKLQASIRVLFARLKQHQQRLNELQDWSDHWFVDAEKQRLSQWGVGKQAGFAGTRSYPPIPPSSFPSQQQFDSLELDRYHEVQLLVQSILEDAVQLSEATEALELFATESTLSLEKQRRLLTSTRDALMEARMLPLGEIMGRLPRVLQQLKTLHNKSVVLTLQGTDVLVDKVVAEKLYGPLLHLVRNAFDHGIESPTLRQQHGKPEQGHIQIHASYQGKFLVIEVRDDGQGLNFDKIRERAVSLSSSPEQVSRLDESQLTNLLFEPGFSTASAVNDLSGRGIGLDVVRAQIQDLQGVVRVDQEQGQGTTFALHIPLNLSISKLLVCQSHERIYALFTDAIEHILIPQADQIRAWEGGKVLRWNSVEMEKTIRFDGGRQGTSSPWLLERSSTAPKTEQLIPVYPLSQILDYFSDLPTTLGSLPKRSFLSKGAMRPIILIRCQDELMGLEVDQLVGEQELVIRPLDATIAPPNYVYGGSILANGQLALVLDGAVLMQSVVSRHTQEDSAYSTSPALSAPPQPPLLSAHTRTALPAAEREHRRIAPASVTPPTPTVQAPPRVLLVDDSITLRQTLALTLQKAGYQVLQAKDGYEAIAQLQEQADIQLVICDIEMPRMNGFEFLKHRQQDSMLSNIPVVMLTSRSGEKHRLIASELGATAYITKPFLEYKLLAIVQEAVENSKLSHSQ
jgi:chemotaxis protein histidine kinase CheA/ActR/RegA family two-component response regulator